jgi:hypothetical protein
LFQFEESIVKYPDFIFKWKKKNILTDNKL